MGDNQYNKYMNEFQQPYQVKANVSTNNGGSQQFAYNLNSASPVVGFESNTHLSSLSNCVSRLQTQLNQYLTKIIDEGSEGGGGNYNLGSGEVLNSHLMEQYASQPNTASAFSSSQADPGSSMNNGYSYYSNFPPNYSGYPQSPPSHSLGGGGGPQPPYGMIPPDYYNSQYSHFQEPKVKKNKNK